MSIRLMEGFCLVGEVILLETAAEDFQVVGVKDACVLGNLCVVGIDLELASLMADDGNGTKAGGCAVVGTRVGMRVVEHASLVSIGKGETAASLGTVTFATSHATCDHVILTRMNSLPAKGVVGAESVEMAVVALAPALNPATHHLVVAPKFIANAECHETGMIAKLAENAVCLAKKELVEFLRILVQRPPDRQFHLQVNAHAVGCHEGCFRGCVAVETEMVEPIQAGGLEEAHPRLHIRRTVGGEGKDATVVGAAQERAQAVDGKLGAFCAKIAEPESDLF